MYKMHVIVRLPWLIMKTLLCSVITWSYTPVITAVVLIIQLKNGRLIRKIICLFSLRIFVFNPSMHTRTFLTACALPHVGSCELVTITHACTYTRNMCFTLLSKVFKLPMVSQGVVPVQLTTVFQCEANPMRSWHLRMILFWSFKVFDDWLFGWAQ